MHVLYTIFVRVESQYICCYWEYLMLVNMCGLARNNCYGLSIYRLSVVRSLMFQIDLFFFYCCDCVVLRKTYMERIETRYLKLVIFSTPVDCNCSLDGLSLPNAHVAPSRYWRV